MTSVINVLNNIHEILETKDLNVWANDLHLACNKLEKFIKENPNCLVELVSFGLTSFPTHILGDVVCGELMGHYEDDINILRLLAQTAERITTCYGFFCDCDILRAKIFGNVYEHKVLPDVRLSLDSLYSTINDGSPDKANNVLFRFPIYQSVHDYVYNERSRNDLLSEITNASNYIWFSHSMKFSLFIGFNRFINE
ncbi:P26 [Yam asymptomatic virus 1]|uniref:P26 n=1 Tax=Yam asymptomatic virus 1 TaxID=2771210 RepID=A0A7H1JMI0_9CLOS|nr:P26 [Yam asymptomatic virus 1]QNT12727.1 P26 [Yam asymptomatic virus 1]